MAGRGFSFKPFLKPSVSQEASGSEAKAEGPSVPAILSPAPSTTGSSAVFLPTLGRGIGRGLAFPKTSPPKQDADQSSIITTIGKGRGIAGISGRGMFAMKINVPIEVAETPKPQPLIVGEQKIKTSDPKASDSGPSKVLSNSEIVGRVAAGPEERVTSKTILIAFVNPPIFAGLLPRYFSNFRLSVLWLRRHRSNRFQPQQIPLKF